MRQTIFLLIIIISSSLKIYSQNHEINLDKYLYLRERLRNDFVVVDPQNRQGTNIPFQHRYMNRHALCNWENTMIHGMMPYLILLATEYAVEKKYNKTTDRTLNELSYALRAIDRLDLNAEKFFKAREAIEDTLSIDFWYEINKYKNNQDLNGFFLRCDYESYLNNQNAYYYKPSRDTRFYNDSALLKNYNYRIKYIRHYNNNTIYSPYPSADTNIFVYKNNLPFYKGVNNTNRTVMSQDEVWGLFLGLAMVAKLVDSPVSFRDSINNVDVTLQEWAVNIVIRINKSFEGPYLLNLLLYKKIINPVTEDALAGLDGGIVWNYRLFYNAAKKIADMAGVPYNTSKNLSNDDFSKNEPKATNWGNQWGRMNLHLIGETKDLRYFVNRMEEAKGDFGQIANEFYPLYFQLLRDEDIETTWANWWFPELPFKQYVDSIEMELNSMPINGAYFNFSENKIQNKYWGLRSSRTFIPQIESVNIGSDEYFEKMDGEIYGLNSGMDYMILFNMYYLTLSSNYPTQRGLKYNQKNPSSRSIQRAEYAGIISLPNSSIGSPNKTTIIVYDKLVLKQGFRATSTATIHTINGVPFDTTVSQIIFKTRFAEFDLTDYGYSKKNVAKSKDNTKLGNTDTSNVYKLNSPYSSTIQKVQKEILVYPNPAHDYVRLLYLPDDTKSISITDLYGRQLKRVDGEKSIIYINTLQSGIYQIKIHTVNNVIVKKLLIN